MSAIARCALSFEVLLEYTSIEHHRWQDWFEANAAAWRIPFASPPTSTIGGLVNHIFGVELRYTQRLRDEQVSEWDELLVHTSIEDVFALGDNARALLVEFLTRASEDELDRVLTFRTLTAGTVTASKHKIAANIFLHGIRHWSQIATVVRQHGFATDWPHDMLLADIKM
ncbi:MAG TPA: DinB family protein [Gemmatimonadaceae bacterium]|nr:DinB family protein [Gemmatimonadaceae bacterium]